MSTMTKADAWRVYEPRAEAPWNLRRVHHLHRRAGFGATWEELQRDLQRGPQESIAAVLRGGPPGAEILSSVIYGQAELHAEFGGIVPEIAARAHAEKVDLAVEEALQQAGLSLSGIDAVADHVLSMARAA